MHLSLLRTCRLVYGEVHLLPFESYTFDFAESLNASRISDRLPMTSGLRRIEDVHWYGHCCANELYQLVVAFLGMKSLKASRESNTPIQGCDDDWKRFFSVNPLRSAQVVIGSIDSAPDTQDAYRAHSSALETFLSGSSWEEAKEVANMFLRNALLPKDKKWSLRILEKTKGGKPSAVCHGLTAQEIQVCHINEGLPRGR